MNSSSDKSKDQQFDYNLHNFMNDVSIQMPKFYGKKSDPLSGFD